MFFYPPGLITLQVGRRTGRFKFFHGTNDEIRNVVDRRPTEPKDRDLLRFFPGFRRRHVLIYHLEKSNDIKFEENSISYGNNDPQNVQRVFQ